MRKSSQIVVDLAQHPHVQWACVLAGQLLPIRFATEREADTHLEGLRDLRQESGRPPKSEMS
jgi:hypothetical protein